MRIKSLSPKGYRHVSFSNPAPCPMLDFRDGSPVHLARNKVPRRHSSWKRSTTQVSFENKWKSFRRLLVLLTTSTESNRLNPGLQISTDRRRGSNACVYRGNCEIRAWLCTSNFMSVWRTIGEKRGGDPTLDQYRPFNLTVKYLWFGSLTGNNNLVIRHFVEAR